MAFDPSRLGRDQSPVSQKKRNLPRTILYTQQRRFEKEINKTLQILAINLRTETRWQLRSNSNDKTGESTGYIRKETVHKRMVSIGKEPSRRQNSRPIRVQNNQRRRTSYRKKQIDYLIKSFRNRKRGHRRYKNQSPFMKKASRSLLCYMFKPSCISKE